MDIKLVSKIIAYLFFLLIIIVLLFIPFFELKFSSFFPLFKDKRFLKALFFGLQTSIIATIISVLFGIPSGYFLAKNKNLWAKIIDSIFDIPLIIPPLIVGAMLLICFNKFLPQFIFTPKGAIIAQFFISFPYILKSSKNSFELVPDVYEQIALTLGAKPLRSFFDTTFKLSFGGILSGIILSWIRSFGEFGATLLVGGGISNKTENIPIYIYQTISEGNFEKGLSASILIIFIGIIFLFMIKKKFS